MGPTKREQVEVRILVGLIMLGGIWLEAIPRLASDPLGALLAVAATAFVAWVVVSRINNVRRVGAPKQPESDDDAA